MIEAIERLKSDGVALINDAKTLNDVNNVKVKIFGKNGDFTIAMRGLKDVPREQKPEVGKMFNDVKVMLEGRIAEKEAEFKEIEWGNKLLDLTAGKIDCIWNGMTIENTHKR